MSQLIPGVSERILHMIVESGAEVSANTVVENMRGSSIYMASDSFGSAEVRGVLKLLETNAFWLSRCARTFEDVKRFLSSPPAYVSGRGTLCIVALDISKRKIGSEEKETSERDGNKRAPTVLGICVAETDFKTTVEVVDIVPTIRGGTISAGKAIVRAVRRHPRFSFVLQAAMGKMKVKPRAIAATAIASIDPTWFLEG